jgi:hypothetical protein
MAAYAFDERLAEVLRLPAGWRFAAIGKIAPCRLVHCRKLAQESHHCPGLVVAILRGPRRHSGEAHPVLDDSKQLSVGPFADFSRKLGWLRQHQQHGRRAGFAGRAVADGAAAREMAGRGLNGMPWQFVGRLHCKRIGAHGRTHREMQEPFGYLPVAGGGADVEEADPGRQQHSERQDGQGDREVFPVDVHQTAFRAGALSNWASSAMPPAR